LSQAKGGEKEKEEKEEEEKEEKEKKEEGEGQNGTQERVAAERMRSVEGRWCLGGERGISLDETQRIRNLRATSHPRKEEGRKTGKEKRKRKRKGLKLLHLSPFLSFVFSFSC
jgi:hypothetical protein